MLEAYLKVLPRDLIRHACVNHAEEIAVITHNQSICYGELSVRVSAFACELSEAGVRPGTQVALSLQNSLDFILGYFGILEAGGIVLTLSPKLALSETRLILEDSRAAFFVEGERQTIGSALGLSEIAKTGGGEGIRVWKNSTVGRVLCGPDSCEWRDAYVVRQFSSGTTGRPNSVFRSQANLAHDYWHFCKTLKLGKDEVFFGIAPFCHAYGSLSFLAAFYLGATISVLPGFLPAPVLAAASRDCVTVFLASPPMIDVLSVCAVDPEDERAFEQLKYCICSTGMLGKESSEAFEARFGVRVNVQYGSTETLSTTIDLSLDGFERGRVGYPYQGVEVRVFSPDGQVCQRGQRGRVGVKSPAVVSSYAEGTQGRGDVFSNDYVFPGDEGRMDESGCLYLLGRSGMINIGGNKVDPLEVVAVIRSALNVKDVFVLEGAQGGLPVVRVIIEANPSEILRSEVLELCRNNLADYKVPRQIEIREKLERDVNGKIKWGNILE